MPGHAAPHPREPRAGPGEEDALQAAWQLFRALVARGIVEIVPRPVIPRDSGWTGPEESADEAKLRVNVDLQDDFSMDQALSLYLLETIPLLDPTRRPTPSTS